MKKADQIEIYQKYMTIAPIPDTVLKSYKAELSGEEALLMGHRYFKGTEMEQDHEKAVQYYNIAADKGLAEAYLALSVCYKLGSGVTADREKGDCLEQKATALWHKNLYQMMGLEELEEDFKNIRLKKTETDSKEKKTQITFDDRNQENTKNFLDRDFKKILFEGASKLCELSSVEKIVFADSIADRAIFCPQKDISQKRDGSIIGWIEKVKNKVNWIDSFILHIEGNGTIYAPGNCEGLFSDFTGVEEIRFGSAFDTSNTYNMRLMFSGCRLLKILDISGFDTSNVTNMGCMFLSCMSLERVDVSRFMTQKVTNMGGMFCGCSGLKTVDVSGFITRDVTNMARMFYGCSSLETVDVSHFYTNSATDRSEMFKGCTSLPQSYWYI